MPFEWRAKKQLTYLGILALIPLVVLIYFAFRALPEPAPEEPILENVSDPVILWTRLLKLSDGIYEVAALLENTHNSAATERFFYRTKIFDENNIVIGIKEGETFINPREKFLIVEPGFLTGQRMPVRASIEFDSPKWQRAEYSPPNITVVSRNFSFLPQPALNAVIRNNDIFPANNIQIGAELSDESGTVIAASFTNIERMEGGAERQVSFSWPVGAIQEEPSAIKFFIRTRAF